jgi:hypothetical protein
MRWGNWVFHRNNLTPLYSNEGYAAKQEGTFIFDEKTDDESRL